MYNVCRWKSDICIGEKDEKESGGRRKESMKKQNGST
jgi:hypothetical protein